MGLRVFDDGHGLIQVKRGGVLNTKRGKGGEREGLRALKLIEARLSPRSTRSTLR